ncbi:MAG: hypothetical protein PVS3B3_35230 [Ktedonobacteraceae bacterium]
MDRDIIIFEITDDTPPNNCPICRNCPYVAFELRPAVYYQDISQFCVGHHVEYMGLMKRHGLFPEIRTQ